MRQKSCGLPRGLLEAGPMAGVQPAGDPLQMGSSPPAGEHPSHKRKRTLPQLDVQVPAPREVPTSSMSWQTEMHMANTPSQHHRGSVLEPLDKGIDAISMPSPSDALMRMRLATPKAKTGALAPLTGAPKLAPAAMAADGDMRGPSPAPPPPNANGGRYSLRPRPRAGALAAQKLPRAQGSGELLAPTSVLSGSLVSPPADDARAGLAPTDEPAA